MPRIIWVGKDRRDERYLLVNEVQAPDMHPECDPGPTDEEEARFWGVHVSVYFVDLIHDGDPIIKDVTWMPSTLRSLYNKYAMGRNDRVYLWQVIKHLEGMNTKEGNGK